jgi:hypothetical protein
MPKWGHLPKQQANLLQISLYESVAVTWLNNMETNCIE